MPIKAAASLQNIPLAGQNKMAVVAGGTRGIGGGVARLLAKIGCSRIIILGRNEKQGREAVEVLKKLAPKGRNIATEFIKGDLSWVTDSIHMNLPADNGRCMRTV
jgi:NAD(P)-dependent dehydrogenase (short-subunit alcohol dehydrogenase family)